MNRVRWLNFSTASLLLLLQRTPAWRVVSAAATESAAPSRIVALLRAAFGTAASLGAVHALAGATRFVVSSPNVLGTVGTAITPVAFTVTGAAIPASSFRVTVRITSKIAAAAGIALAEVYDTEGVSAPVRLINVSTNGFVGSGDQALVPGFVIGGTAPKQLLIRAVGPGLAQFGVSDTLADPQLSLVPLGRDFAVAANDNWGGTAALQAAFAAAGAFALPVGSNDAAVVVRLPPGGYTVVVSGVTNGTGTALVEIYDLDP